MPFRWLLVAPERLSSDFLLIVDATLPPRGRFGLFRMEDVLRVGLGDALYHIEPRAAFPEVQLNASSMSHEPNCTVDDVLQNGFHAPTTDLYFLRCESGAHKHFLSERSKQVECNHRAKQDDFIGAQLPGRKPLDIHIAFELAMKLLASAVIVVEFDDGFGRARQVAPPRVYFDGWY